VATPPQSKALRAKIPFGSRHNSPRVKRTLLALALLLPLAAQGADRKLADYKQIASYFQMFQIGCSNRVPRRKPRTPPTVLNAMRSLTLALLFTATTASAGIFGDCSFKADRSVAAPAPGITHITIIGRAGGLRISGHRGAAEIVAHGTACASSRGRLDETKLAMSRSGSELRIEALVPESAMWGDASLDFEVTLPDTVPLTVEDGSGDLTIENVASSDVTDGSGELTIRNVNGSLDVNDGSGEMTIENVTGGVHINDGSGGIDVRGAGSVEISNDGSGEVTIHQVRGDVTIGNKGSGSIDIADVGGNVLVRNKGGGSINWERVTGHVQVPERFRK
jgi:hypothetical protein